MTLTAISGMIVVHVKATFNLKKSVPRFLSGDHWHCIKTQTFASVFRHHCSSPDIYRFGHKVVIKNFRDKVLLFLVI